jgi:hypothetical protein
MTVLRSCTSRDELKQRLDSKSPVGTYIGRVFDTSAIYLIANPWTLKYLFLHLLSTTKLLFTDSPPPTKASGRQAERYQSSLFREVCDTAELITLLGKYLPAVRTHLSLPTPLPSTSLLSRFFSQRIDLRGLCSRSRRLALEHLCGESRRE